MDYQVMEINMKNVSEINMIDYRSLTSGQRSALIRALTERARRERAEFLVSLGRALYRRYDRAIEWMLRVYFSPRPPANLRRSQKVPQRIREHLRLIHVGDVPGAR